jgi:hypothetical protein
MDGPETQGIVQATPFVRRWEVKSYLSSVAYGPAGGGLIEAPADLFVGVIKADILGASLAFDALSLPVFAIEASPGNIEVRRYVAGVATTSSFAGTKPRLFADGILQTDVSLRDVVCFYQSAGSIKARFERDNFGIEYDIIYLPVLPNRITKVDRSGQYIMFYFRDDDGAYRVARSYAYPA